MNKSYFTNSRAVNLLRGFSILSPSDIQKYALPVQYTQHQVGYFPMGLMLSNLGATLILPFLMTIHGKLSTGLYFEPRDVTLPTSFTSSRNSSNVISAVISLLISFISRTSEKIKNTWPIFDVAGYQELPNI